MKLVIFVKLGAYVITTRPENIDVESLEKNGQCRELGVAFIELGPLTAPLTDISGDGISQKIRFIRKKGSKENKVG